MTQNRPKRTVSLAGSSRKTVILIQQAEPLNHDLSPNLPGNIFEGVDIHIGEPPQQGADELVKLGR